MQPHTINADEVWPDFRRVVMRAPEGYDPLGEIRPVEVQRGIIMVEDRPLEAFVTKITLDSGDLARLEAGEPIWLVQLSQMVPFDLGFADEFVDPDTQGPTDE